jgi:hypothetical protein
MGKAAWILATTRMIALAALTKPLMSLKFQIGGVLDNNRNYKHLPIPTEFEGLFKSLAAQERSTARVNFRH